MIVDSASEVLKIPESDIEATPTLMQEGGISDCGKAGNCAEVCPKQIPLLESIAAVQQ